MSVSIPQYHRSLLDWIMLMIPLVFIATVCWVLFVPVRTLEPRRQPYRVVTPVVKIGQPITYEVDACKYIDAPALVYRQLVSDKRQVVALPSVTSNLPPGCQHNFSSSTAVPIGTPPGRWHLEMTLVYQLYGFRSTSINLKTDYFTIIAP